MNFLKNVFLLSLCAFVFVSCEKEKDVAIDGVKDSFEEEKREILEYLDAQNYNIDSVGFKGDMVFYERDMAWYLPHLMKTIHGEIIIEEESDPDQAEMIFAKDRQHSINEAMRLDAVTRNNVASITYFIRSSVLADCGLDWHLAILGAAADWTALNFCRVNMTRVFEQNAADVIFGSDLDTGMPTSMQNLAGGTIALARFPQNGLVGRHVSINASYDWLPKKRTAMIHEIGHTFGFEHTGGGDGGQWVHGTPLNESGSVMSPTFLSANSTFKPGDIRMARMFYPDSYNVPTNFTAENLGNGKLGISYQNPSYVSRPYYWIRIAVYNTAGNITSVQYHRATANVGSTVQLITLDVSGWKGSHLFALRGCNFRRDVWSPRTPQVLVNF